jgi:hypothetical protein
MLPWMFHEARALPRPLSDREIATLDLMLGIDDPRLDPLREQARNLVVTWECTCGCATVNFDVDRNRTAAAVDLCNPVTETQVRAPYDREDFCELILFLEDGWLSSLEIVWYAKPIPEVPPVSEFEPATLRC